MRRLSTNDFVLDAELTNVSSSEYATNAPPATQMPSARPKRIQKDPHGGHNKSSRRTSQVTPPVDATAAPIVPHVNYAWRTLERVKYERYGPGEPILVAPPPGVEGEPQPCHRVALLRTRALDEPREVYRHCVHYVLNDACDFGATCCNIHSVFVATDARLYQKATHYRRHEGKKAVEELSTVCHVGDHALGRDAPAVTPPRYFYHDPYASTEDHRVFVVPPSLQRSPTAAAKRRQPKALRPAPSVPQPPPPSSPPSPT